MYVYTYTCIIRINQKRTIEFERQKGPAYGQEWVEGEKGRGKCNYITIFPKIKKKLIKLMLYSSTVVLGEF